MSRHAVSADGLSLWRGVAAAELPWAAGPLLPTVGQSSWTVRVADVIRIGWLYIGVCDAASLDSWSLFLFGGLLSRQKRDASGAAMTVLNDQTGGRTAAPPPTGFPDGNGKQVLFNAERNRPDNLRGRATGALVEVCLDHDKGTLSFGINGGPLQRALDGFPVGAAMRPFAKLPIEGDWVRFARPYIYHKAP